MFGKHLLFLFLLILLILCQNGVLSQSSIYSSLLSRAAGSWDMKTKDFVKVNKEPDDCPHAEDVNPSDPYYAKFSPETVRLRGENGNVGVNRGRVEVKNPKTQTWTGICDDYFSQGDGNVVCRDLGFSKGAYKVYQKDMFGDGGYKDSDLDFDLVCHGHESSLESCIRMPVDCIGRSAGVMCYLNDGCPKDSFSYNGVCYSVQEKHASFVEAVASCQKQGKKLAMILTAQENHYLSQLLYNNYPNITKAWVGGQFIETTDIRTGISMSAWRWISSIHMVDREATKGLWFPGFEELDFIDKRPRPKSNRTESCIALSRAYQILSSMKHEDLGYYFWENLSCNSKLPFICQSKATTTRSSGRADCYNDNGVDYRGQASRTLAGSVCAKWTDSYAQVNPSSHPFKGLGDHNYCRNPDNDIRPWCWTVPRSGVYGYCDVPLCSSVEEPSEPSEPEPQDTAGFGNGSCDENYYYCPSQAAYGDSCIPRLKVCNGNKDCILGEDENQAFCRNYTCMETQFYCPRDTFCISVSQKCNGNPDCSDGADEVNCPDTDVESKYRKTENEVLPKSIQRYRYYGRDLKACEELCSGTATYFGSGFVCRSFNYYWRSAANTYPLCELNSDIADGNLVAKASAAYFESILQTACDGEDVFKCANNKCIPIEKKCNQVNDCGDGTDEESCKEVVYPEFKVRLADGPNSHTGRLEVRYHGEWGQVCDDGFRTKEALVACKQMGYSDYVKYIPHSKYLYGSGNSKFILDNVKCTGEETSLEDCKHNPFYENDCTSDEVVALECFVTRGCSEREFICASDRKCISLSKQCDGTKDCADGSDELNDCTLKVQLDNGGDANSGRVVLKKGTKVGNICQSQFTKNDARIICRMLKIDGDVEIITDGRYGKGLGIMSVGNLMCDGTENSIADCLGFKWGPMQCSHSEIVSLRCGRPEVTVTTTPATPKPEPEKPKCGQRFVSQALPRVVGGVRAAHGAFPWQVGVRKAGSYGGYYHWCGGTIISEDWIMSAAHCYADNNQMDFKVVVGDHNNQESDGTEQEFMLENIINHHQYTSDFDYDYALLKIKRVNGKGIEFNLYVQPACLPEKEDIIAPRSVCHVSGWGSTKASYPIYLQMATVPIIENCEKFYYNKITPRMVCAGYASGGIDTCQGDSGGPLVCYVNGKFMLHGDTSWGNGCAEPNNPGVYGRITEARDWIKQLTGL